MMASDHIGQHFLVSVSDVRRRVRVINRCGDEKCLRHLLAQTAGRIVLEQALRLRVVIFLTGFRDSRERRYVMNNCLKIVFSILTAAICTVGFAADKPSCAKTGKNCPMNDNKACNCGKSCSC